MLPNFFYHWEFIITLHVQFEIGHFATTVIPVEHGELIMFSKLALLVILTVHIIDIKIKIKCLTHCLQNDSL